MVDRARTPLTEALALVAPGTPLREGLDRVLQAKRGALIVVGDDPAVLSICTGGFLLDAEFSPQRLSELAKMDGAIILAPDASRIARANVHLVPRASIPTTETGTRHRTAERVARSIDVPVITVSESMSTIAVYRNDQKHILQRTGASSTGPARPSPPSSGSSAASTWPWPASRRWRWRTPCRCATWWRSSSRARWSCGSATRSRATWSSWVTTAA